VIKGIVNHNRKIKEGEEMKSCKTRICGVSGYFFRVLVVFLFSGVCGMAGGEDAKEITSLDEVRNAAPNTWLRVKDSHLRKVGPDPEEYPAIQANRGVHGVIDGWSGGAYDSNRKWFVIFGGGHWAYGGNEVYVFDLNKLEWIRYTDPTKDPVHYKDPQPDGTPISRHTYGGLASLEHEDKLFALGGSPFGRKGGCGLPNTWLFDYKSRKWKNMKPSGDKVRARCGNWCEYDPASDLLWFMDKNSILYYDTAENRWTRKTSINAKYDTGFVFDPRRSRLYVIGKGTTAYYDIEEDKVHDVETTGGEVIVKSSQMGLDYDPVADRIVIWDGDPEVWALNPETHEWKSYEHPGAPYDTDKTKFVERIYGRWRYVPSVNAFITVTSVDADVYFYKLSSGTGGETGS
jgi:hypothetical protein